MAAELFAAIAILVSLLSLWVSIRANNRNSRTAAQARERDRTALLLTNVIALDRAAARMLVAPGQPPRDLQDEFVQYEEAVDAQGSSFADDAIRAAVADHLSPCRNCFHATDTNREVRFHRKLTTSALAKELLTAFILSRP